MALKVLVDEHEGNFRPEEHIVGTIHLSVVSPDFKEVGVRLVGEEWIDSNQAISIHNTKNTFLETKNILLQSGELSIGDYAFPFELIIPRFVPSTFLGEHGFVKFFVRATLTTNQAETSEDQAQVEVVVFSPIELDHQSLLVPCIRFDQRTLKKSWLIEEKVKMEVRLEKNAFVLGELMDITVRVRNNSSFDVSSVKIRVIRRVSTKVLAPTEECLLSYETEGFGSYRTINHNIRIALPETIRLLNFQGCKLFTMITYLEVTTTMYNCPAQLNVRMLVILGHIPPGERDETPENIKAETVHNALFEFLKSSLPDRPSSMPSLHHQKWSSGKISNAADSLLPSPYSSIRHRNVSLPQVPLYPPVPPSVSLETVPSGASNYKYHFTHDNYLPTDMFMVLTTSDPQLSTSRKVDESRNALNICPYPIGISTLPPPYPTATIPYPKDDSSSTMPMPSGFVKAECPPYPSDADGHTQMPRLPPDIDIPSVSVSTLPPPYPTANTPYPKDDSSSAMPMPSGFVKAECPPYPSDGDGHTQMPRLPPDIDISSVSVSNTPYPAAVIARSDTNPPYPTEHFGSMPVPEKASIMSCDTIGFAVPTSVAPHTYLPSAPLLSDIKTPPIADIEELKELKEPPLPRLSVSTSSDESSSEDLFLPEVPNSAVPEDVDTPLLEDQSTSNKEDSLPPTKTKKERRKLKEALAS